MYLNQVSWGLVPKLTHYCCCNVALDCICWCTLLIFLNFCASFKALHEGNDKMLVIHQVLCRLEPGPRTSPFWITSNGYNHVSFSWFFIPCGTFLLHKKRKQWNEMGKKYLHFLNISFTAALLLFTLYSWLARNEWPLSSTDRCPATTYHFFEI